MKKVWLFTCVLLSAGAVVAALPEPDNIVYGRIVIGGVVVTAADTDVSVEARGGSNELYAAYAMGADPSAGDYYRLVVPVEAFPPVVASNTCVIGGGVRLIAKRNGVEVRHYDLTITERGVVARIDLGGVDDDGDGVPDAWELALFGDLTTITATSNFDGDRMTDKEELIAGSNLKDPLSMFFVNDVDAVEDGWCRVAWESAEGRTYALDVSTNLLGSSWQRVVDGVMATPPANTYEIQVSADSVYVRVSARASMATP